MLATILVSALVVAVAPSAGVANSDTHALSSVVDAVVEAYGGQPALEKMKAFRHDSVVLAHRFGSEGKARRDFMAPDRLRAEIVYPDRTELRIVDGTRGWRGDARSQRAVKGPPHDAMVFQLLRSALPLSLVQHRDKLSLGEAREEAGVRYRLLHLRYSDTLALDFWVEEQSHYVGRVEARIAAGPSEIVFGARYRDFRRVEGVTVPFAEENFASGRHIGTTKVKAVTFGAKGLGPFAPKIAM